MMSKKNYEQVAEVIRAEYDEASGFALEYEGLTDGVFAVERIANACAALFKRDNPRFDRDRFIVAALGREPAWMRQHADAEVKA